MDGQELIIEAGHRELRYWRDPWKSQEIFFFLAWRDVLGRYKQIAIGATQKPLFSPKDTRRLFLEHSEVFA